MVSQANNSQESRIVFLNSYGQKSPLTITVSKKIFKTAVLRNNVKRKIREAYRLAIKSMELQDVGKHDTLYPFPFLRIQIKEGVTKMTVAELQAIIAQRLIKNIFKRNYP